MLEILTDQVLFIKLQEDLKIGNMKLLENINFEALSEALTTEDCLDGRIDARIESYR